MESVWQAASAAWHQMASEPRLGILIALLLLAAGIDLRQRRIPNRLVLVGLLCALTLAVLPARIVPHGIGLAAAVGGIGVGLALTLPLYLVKGMAAGDVKLMAMTGAYLGPSGALHAALWSFIAGGVLALLYVMGRRRLGVLGRNVSQALALGAMQVMAGGLPRVEISRERSAGLLPFGVAIAAGSIGFVVAGLAAGAGHG